MPATTEHASAIERAARAIHVSMYEVGQIPVPESAASAGGHELDYVRPLAAAALEAVGYPGLLKAAKRALVVLKATGESVRPGNALGALEAAIAESGGTMTPAPKGVRVA